MTILAVSDESLLQYGWAPGGYMIRCMDCGGDGLGGNDGCAKRSSRCRACAVKCWERDIAKPAAPMTGDGAVVRVDHESAALWARYRIDYPHSLLHPASDANLASAYLEREAEIERLNDKLIEWQREWYGWRSRLEASEARTADLLKLIADLADNLSDEGVIYSDDGLDDRRKRVADALGNDCPEWLLEHQSAAAKGETVGGEPKPADMHDMDYPGTCYHCGAEAHDCKCDGGIS